MRVDTFSAFTSGLVKSTSLCISTMQLSETFPDGKFVLETKSRFNTETNPIRTSDYFNLNSNHGS